MAAEYPTKVTTQLKTAVNNLSLNLTDDVGEDASEIFVGTTEGAPASGSFHIENEIIFYPAKTSIKFGPGLTRGADGTTKAVHLKTLAGGEVKFGPEAHFINNLNDELIATQTKLGIGSGLITDAIAEKTVNTGVTVDGLLIKDGGLTSPLFTGTIDGWISTGTFTYASATTITVASGAASIYKVNDKIKFTQATGGTKYAYITVVADALLTINLSGLYTLENEAITAPYYSHIENPLGFPILPKSKLITATRDQTADSGDVSYTGVGFTPTSILAISALSGGSIAVSAGFADSAKASGNIIQTATDTFNTGTSLISRSYASGSQEAIVKSYDADGFTLTWTKTGSPTGTLNIKFLCFR